jgi:hypothetical protein
MSDFGTPGSIPPPSSSAGRTGPAWEQPGPFLGRWIDTAKTILMDPKNGFANVRRSGGLGAPLTYYAVGAAPAIIGLVLLQLLGLGGMAMGGGDGAGLGALIGGAGLIGFLLLLVVVFLLGFFFITGIVHLVLSLLGGASHGYEATARTFAYAYGSATPLSWIPCLGALAGIWGLVCAIMGLANMQDTTPVKAAIAIFAPVILCCVLGFVFGAAMMAMLGLGAGAAQM